MPAKKRVKRVQRSFGDRVRAELDQIFKVDTNFKTQYKHLRELARILKTRALRTVRRKTQKRARIEK